MSTERRCEVGKGGKVDGEESKEGRRRRTKVRRVKNG